MNKLYIWGWWQGNNLGDNWIKKTLEKLFPEAIFVDTTTQKFEKNSFVICGGGGLFIYDVIEPWTNVLHNISYGMLGLGAEFSHTTNIANSLAKKAKFFYVRDQYSLDCMHIENLERSYDITFAFPLKKTELKKVKDEKVFFVWRDGKELINNPLFRNYIQVGSCYSEWKKIISEHFENIIEDDFQTRDDNIEERIGDAGFVISGRYHGIVAAIQKGLPFVAIDICPKIRALLEDIGLDDYCIKMSEIEKLPILIEKAKANIENIREKEQEYVECANKKLMMQIADAKLEILKVLKPLNIIHYGSYWMKENDVVNVMADDLADECNLKKIDLKVYTSHPNRRIEKNEDTPNGKLCVLDYKKILNDARRYKADAIILNSGGLCLTDEGFDEMRKREITTVGISLSDPDVFPYNGKKYANKFDLFYTNSKYSYENEYDTTKGNIGIMPFGASTKHHYYMPDILREYDVVVVGHAREDRKRIVSNLETICSVGTYGNGWDHSLGVVNGIEHVKAINRGRIYLSFSRTVAGFENVKVGLFEAMACNQVVITSYMEELKDYFEIGKEILCYRTEEELYELIKYYLSNEIALEEVRKKGYTRFLKDHTYQKRWNEVLRSIYKEKRKI